MHTNRFLKGLAVGAAGGALVLAGVAGTGTVASAAPSQDATVNASPDRANQTNIYNMLQGDLKGKSGSWDEIGSVHGGWIQGAMGELLVKDSHGTHSWKIKDVKLTPATLKFKLQVGGVWNSGTLQGTKNSDRVSTYHGTLDSTGSDHIRITNFKVQSEFRGYDITEGELVTKVSIFTVHVILDSGCLFRGKGSVLGKGMGMNVKADLSSAAGKVTSTRLQTHLAVTAPSAAAGVVMDLDVTGANHVYSGSGTTGGKPWTLKDLKLVKRTSTSPACTWSTTP